MLLESPQLFWAARCRRSFQRNPLTAPELAGIFSSLATFVCMMLRLLPGRNSHNILHFGIVYIVCFGYFNISVCPAYELANNSCSPSHAQQWNERNKSLACLANARRWWVSCSVILNWTNCTKHLSTVGLQTEPEVHSYFKTPFGAFQVHYDRWSTNERGERRRSNAVVNGSKCWSCSIIKKNCVSAIWPYRDWSEDKLLFIFKS